MIIRIGELAVLVLVLVLAMPGSRAWADAGDQASSTLMQTEEAGGEQAEEEEEEEPDCE